MDGLTPSHAAPPAAPTQTQFAPDPAAAAQIAANNVQEADAYAAVFAQTMAPTLPPNLAAQMQAQPQGDALPPAPPPAMLAPQQTNGHPAGLTPDQAQWSATTEKPWEGVAPLPATNGHPAATPPQAPPQAPAQAPTAQPPAATTPEAPTVSAEDQELLAGVMGLRPEEYVGLGAERVSALVSRANEVLDLTQPQQPAGGREAQAETPAAAPQAGEAQADVVAGEVPRDLLDLIDAAADEGGPEVSAAIRAVAQRYEPILASATLAPSQAPASEAQIAELYKMVEDSINELQMQQVTAEFPTALNQPENVQQLNQRFRVEWRAGGYQSRTDKPYTELVREAYGHAARHLFGATSERSAAATLQGRVEGLLKRQPPNGSPQAALVQPGVGVDEYDQHWHGSALQQEAFYGR